MTLPSLNLPGDNLKETAPRFELSAEEQVGLGDHVDVWAESLGLDLEQRTVLEAEVLAWRLAQSRSLAGAAVR